MSIILSVSRVKKEFRLHQQGDLRIPVFSSLDLEVQPGEAIGITGASGCGKSSLLKLIYATYRATAGSIRVLHRSQWIDIAAVPARLVLEIRRDTIGYVTQFLRVIPRVPALDVVAEPLLERQWDEASAYNRARDLLSRLNVPERLWQLSPLTFSGGEQQRVNIARGFAAHYPILLLDEPTASLDAENRERVLQLIESARDAGTSVLGVFHDALERKRICSRTLDLGAAR